MRLLPLVITIALLSCDLSASGAPTATDAADAYVAALQSRDAEALRRTAPPDFDTEAAAAEKLAKYAGIDLGAIARAYIPDEMTPNIVTVRFTVATVPTFGDSVSLQRFGNRWYVMLGRVRGYTPSTTTGPRPPGG